MSGPRYPLTYEVELDRKDGEPMTLAAGGRPHVVCGPPPEFGGSDTWWSPEHLLVAATSACFTATFYAMAKRAEIRIGSFHCKATGTLSHSSGAIAFTSIDLAVDLRVLEDDVARASLVLADAKARCFVANSLRCPIELVSNVSAT